MSDKNSPKNIEELSLPRVQEIKALIQQNKYNVIVYDAQCNYGTTSERIKGQEKKKIAEGVIDLLLKELIELRIYCTHKKLDGISAISAYTNNCEVCGFKK